MGHGQGFIYSTQTAVMSAKNIVLQNIIAKNIVLQNIILSFTCKSTFSNIMHRVLWW